MSCKRKLLSFHRICSTEEMLVAILHLHGDTLPESWTSPREGMLRTPREKEGPMTFGPTSSWTQSQAIPETSQTCEPINSGLGHFGLGFLSLNPTPSKCYLFYGPGTEFGGSRHTPLALGVIVSTFCGILHTQLGGFYSVGVMSTLVCGSQPPL